MRKRSEAWEPETEPRLRRLAGLTPIAPDDLVKHQLD